MAAGSGLEGPVDLRVCECCPDGGRRDLRRSDLSPSVTARDDETRDIHVSRLEKGKLDRAEGGARGRLEDQRLSGQRADAQRASGRDVAVAWFTVQEDQGHAFVAFSKDAGRTFAAPIRLDDGGALGRVDVELMPDGSAVASWIELADQRAQFQGSSRRTIRRPVPGRDRCLNSRAGRASGYPRMAANGDEIVFAWIESADDRLQVWAPRLPACRPRMCANELSGVPRVTEYF